jgi:hypothetical protein
MDKNLSSKLMQALRAVGDDVLKGEMTDSRSDDESERAMYREAIAELLATIAAQHSAP